MNSNLGSTWNKWDLHVHTPASIVHHYSGAGDVWENFITELEKIPPEIKAIGINDYIFIEGYKKVLAYKTQGRLKNIEVIFPVIELRLDKFGGSESKLSKVNFHVIFSNEISPEIIQTQFINALPNKYTLSPQYENLKTKWNALPTRQSLEELGSLIIGEAPENKKKDYGSPIEEGFNNISFKLDEIEKVLEYHYFEGKYILAVGKTEWADIRWNDQSIADKKNIINAAKLVFISADSPESYHRNKKALVDAGVNKKLIDCSDAHYPTDSSEKDRLGNCFTWIKSDLTFEGLKHAIIEYEDRVYVGNRPDKLVTVNDNKTKYIKTLTLTKVGDLQEDWFDNQNIEFSHDLVAIIGNKGSGKSALADIIGLLGNSAQHETFSFLNSSQFKNTRNNKAVHFNATMIWESGLEISRNLNDEIQEDEVECIKYIPQNYLEKVCNDISTLEHNNFDQELKKVIFSHVDNAKRLGKESFEDLIEYRTAEIYEAIEILKSELALLNTEILQLEKKMMPEYKNSIKKLLDSKNNELRLHDTAKPKEVTKPDNDPNKQKEYVEITKSLETKKIEKEKLQSKLNLYTEKQKVVEQEISTVKKVTAKIENFQRDYLNAKANIHIDLGTLGIRFDDVIQVVVNKSPIEGKYSNLIDELKKVTDQLNPSIVGSTANSIQEIEKEISALRTKLDMNNRLYQEYENKLNVWKMKRNQLVGNVQLSGSIEYFNAILADLGNCSTHLTEAKKRRIEKIKEIFTEKIKIVAVYKELYGSVQDFINSKQIVKDRIKLNFEVSIVNSGFEEGFFNFISHGVSGSFCGTFEAKKVLKSVLDKYDFNYEEQVISFLKEILNCLRIDMRTQKENPIGISGQLRRGQEIKGLYDYLFSMDYLKPKYTLRMFDKELQQLSPGERGTLLLMFYLLVDRNDIPLVIDQPEENLDNQTVYELLVPCIKEAKKRRQVILVTHNPNLAVVCDAEQIIHASIDKSNKYLVRYESGSIENPSMNNTIVNILEGTRPAFENREEKYQSLKMTT